MENRIHCIALYVIRAMQWIGAYYGLSICGRFNDDSARKTQAAVSVEVLLAVARVRAKWRPPWDNRRRLPLFEWSTAGAGTGSA